MSITAFLSRATPAQMGVETETIRTIYRRLSELELGAHGLMFVRHDAVIAEGWWKPWSSGVPVDTPEKAEYLFNE